ncbi:hypothetical protein CKN53_08910 [Acinetobacter baumannii]|uniref:hypothetical protein n=1 Tax=Acinetobacter baumannii TaxID=470 RepID=UPI000BAC866A|nr:hypothetical protein [Acinetobacter baumannii]MBC6786641.1 hypothetical protein [Acinetobacter baumannii]MBC6825767.1 hypothetical protein [Acinetobacter baumannii]MDV5647250.1 hypothetical protein [Acinetobacter baumannii]PAX04713.1 hypothetical protein CKQ60_08105 [Acinetobacter baumannii]RKL56879.1 hypothetical protein CKN55_08280 [Acinetobacter baumannii]
MDKNALLEQFKAGVEASGTPLTHILKMCEFDEVSNDFKSDTVHDYSIGCLNGAWWMFQRQQAKVEELEKEWLEMNQQHEQAVKECFEVNSENRKLQKRVEWLEERLKATDTLSKMRAAVIGSFNTQEFNSRTRRKMMILKQAEQALKGGEQ